LTFYLSFWSVTRLYEEQTYKQLLFKSNSKAQCFLLPLFPLQALTTFPFTFISAKRWIFSRLSSHRNRIKTLSPSIVTLIRLLKLQIPSIFSISTAYGIRFRRFHYVSCICNSRISFLISFCESQHFVYVFCVTAFHLLYRFTSIFYLWSSINANFCNNYTCICAWFMISFCLFFNELWNCAICFTVKFFLTVPLLLIVDANQFGCNWTSESEYFVDRHCWYFVWPHIVIFL
jgi:hypothetical protein